MRNYFDVDFTADKINKLLRDNNISQLQLAKELNVDATTISKWKKGKNITIDTLIKIANYFNVTLEYLIDGTSERLTTDFREVDIDYGVQEFFQSIKGKKTEGISWTDAMNFLIVSEGAYFDPDDTESIMSSVDCRFLKAWATYLSIDTIGLGPQENEYDVMLVQNPTQNDYNWQPKDEVIDQDDNIAIIDTNRRIKQCISIKALEELELCYMVHLLKEKKRLYTEKSSYKKLHKENQEREARVHAEKLSKLCEKFPTIRNIEETEKILKNHNPNSPLPWKDGGTL